jgi:hypothetical protein
MATVNKKFSVKNGLAVDGNVAVSNVTSYTVDGPSSASLTFTLTNVTAATINTNEIVTNAASQVLTNKTFNDTLYFTNPSTTPNDGSIVINDANDNFEITALETDLVLASILGDVILNAANGASYLTSNTAGNEIATQGYVTGLGYLTEETDPVFAASDAYAITSTDISNWGDAYSWGDHALVGYITEETDPVFAASEAFNITSTDTSNWDAAYGWGDHSGAGYLTTESDPVFTASDAFGITSTQITNWDTAYGWGDHSGEGYLTSAVESIATGGDNNIVFSSSTGAVTANLAANVTIGQNLTVTGNLTVSGNVTTLNTETLAVEDNIVVLNTNVTGTPTLDAGVEVERGTYTNAKIYWNETANAWHVATPGDNTDAAVDTAIALAGNVTLVDAAVVSANASATSGAPTVYSWASGTYSTAKFTIQMKQGSDIHVLELLAAIAGSNVYVTEYAEIISNVALGETDVTLDAGTATLTVTPVTGTVVTKIVAQLIEA